MDNETADPQNYGPLRKAPTYYIGERWGKYRTVRPDTERRENGTVPSIRNKAARRLIRAAFGRHHSKVERGLKFARALKAQAVEVVRDEHKGKSRYAQSKIARKLLAAELAIHQPARVPDQKQLRAMRTQARKDKRAGKVDAIGALVDKMSQKP